MYRRNDSIAWNKVDDGFMLLAPKTGQYLHLDNHTCDLLEKLLSGFSVEECAEQTVSQLDNCDLKQVVSDYKDVVSSLVEHGVLEVY